MKRKSDAEKLLESRDKRDKFVSDNVKRKKEQSKLLSDSIVENDDLLLEDLSYKISSSSSIGTSSTSSNTSITSNIHLFYKQSEKSLNVKICLFQECQQEISVTSGSTSHLHEHIKNKHSNEYNIFKVAKTKEEVCTWIRSAIENKEVQDEICALFSKNDVDGEILLGITDEKLEKKYGIVIKETNSLVTMSKGRRNNQNC